MASFPLLWNDWQWFLHYKWEMQIRMMREYVEASESAFEKESDAFADWIAEKEGTVSESDLEFFADECTAKIMSLQDDFPALSRQMAFCAMYGYLEHQLIHVCDALKVFRKLSDDVRDDRQNKGLQRPKLYLKNVAKIAFPDTLPEWAKLLAYGRIRNLILHCSSEVPTAKMEEFSADAKTTGGISIDDARRFSLTTKYVTAAIDTVQKFFDELVKVLPKETERDRKEGLESLMESLRKMRLPQDAE